MALFRLLLRLFRVSSPIDGLPRKSAGKEWDTLNAAAITLWQNGNYGRAIEVGHRALELAEKSCGPEHPFVARSLNNLAVVYKDHGNLSQAEALLERALAIQEKSPTTDHASFARTL